MPGMKDVFIVKDELGNRQELRKRLLLGTLRELYASFKERHPELKVGFSKFCVLKPRECVYVRSCGTHTVCVCTCHQNAKLSILGIVTLYVETIFLYLHYNFIKYCLRGLHVMISSFSKIC